MKRTAKRARVPVHLRGTPRLLHLRRWANSLQPVFGAPVYLVGSALRDDNSDPRDWDVRICLPDHRFAVRYAADGTRPLRTAAVIRQWNQEGLSGKWTRLRHRWSTDCVRYGENGARWTALNIDFQVFPLSHCMRVYFDEPRLRLDRVYPPPRAQRLKGAHAPPPA